METSRLLLALTLTWLPGCVWVARLVPKGASGRRYLVAGYGLLAGLIVVPLIMRGLSASSIPFSFASIGLLAALLLLAGWLLPNQWRAGNPAQPATTAPATPGNPWATLLICICAALIVARLATLGLEVALRPIYAWDGKQHWAKQARVFFEAGSVALYVPFEEWLRLGDPKVYTTVHPDYPITVPLLQVWANIAIGEWHDSLMNLPWVLCYLALGLIFFGQLRAIGASNALAIAPTYMLLSIPYLDTQVALAGYADIFMATCFLAAVAAFYHWTRNRSAGQAILAIFFAFSCLLLKNEGLFWLLSFAPGLLLIWLGVGRGVVSLAALFLLLLLCLWLLPRDLAIAGQSLATIDLRYRPESWASIYRNFLVADNWHLLSYMVIALLPATATLARPALHRVAPVAAVVGSAFVLFLALYLYTRHSVGAVSNTSINRVALQLVPAIGFLATVVFLQLARGGRAAGDSRPAPGR